MDSTSNIELVISRENESPQIVRGISSEDKRTILELLLENKIEIDHSCGGNGSCGTCLFYLFGSLQAITEKNAIELEMAQDRGFSENERLACQTHVLKSCEIKLG
ncbi:MAG: 2Fe-2S iron-sulfur cluster-binding protein [Bdellovibrionales bacterium]